MKHQIGLVTILSLLAFCLPMDTLGQKKKATKPKAQAVKKSSRADDVFNQGAVFFRQKTTEGYQSALEKFNEALILYQNANDRDGEADCYMAIGRIYFSFQNMQKSFDNFAAAIEIYRSKKNYESEAEALNNIGAVFREDKQYEKAVSYYNQAYSLESHITKKTVWARVCNGLGESLLYLGKIAEAKEKILEADSYWASTPNNEDKVRTSFNLARVYLATNEVQKSIDLLNRALSESRQFDNPILEGDILEELATYYVATGNLTKAIEYRRRIFEAYTKAKASTVTYSRILLSVNNLQVSYYRAGDFQNALRYLEEGIKIGQQNNEITSTAYLIGNKGVLLSDQGKYQEAINFLNQGINASRQAGNKYSEAYYLASLAHVYTQLGDFQKAISFANQALQLVPAESNPETEGKVISTLIAAYASAGDRKKTQEMIQLAASRKLDVTIHAGAVQVLYAAGYAQLLFGNHDLGLKLLEQSFQIADKLNHEVEKARVLYTASFGYEKKGDLQTALQAVQKSHDFYKKIGNDVMDMNTHFQMGLYYYKLNQTQASAENFNAALNFAQNLNLTERRATILYNLGYLYANSGNAQTAIDYFNQALPLYENVGSGENQKVILNNLAEIYEKSGDKKKAKEFRDKAKKVRN